MPDDTSPLSAALAQFQAGDLPSAETLCREVLAVDAANGEALHLLGVIAHRSNRNEAAVELVKRAMAADGEGASKLIQILVRGGRTEAEARQVGLSVANSSLVKTASFGNDPNWGRILCAMGYAGVDIEPGDVEVSLCGTTIYADGSGAAYDADVLSNAMKEKEITIDIDLAMGQATAEIFTCDLTYDYVRLNAEYTT